MKVSNLSIGQLTWLFVAQAAAIIPVFFVLPFWVIPVFITAIVWRVQIYRSALHFPNSVIKTCLAVTLVAAIFLSVAQTISVEAFVGFFVISFTLKTLELYDRSDGLLIVSISFIGIAIGFLFFQTFYMAFYALIALVLVLQAWILLYRERKTSIKGQLSYALQLLAKTLPLMLLMFIVMPRLGQIWHMPSQSQTGVTGFSETMAPGGLSNLVESKAVAFRVSFDDGTVPAPADRYWRALVLENLTAVPGLGRIACNDGAAWLPLQNRILIGD